MERPLTLAFLGCGAIAQRHARTLRRVAPEVRLRYASRDAARAEAFRARLGGDGAYGSYEAAWSDPGVDVVLAATPPHLHLEQTLAALAAGRHVIVEKPAFPRPDDVTPVRAAAEAAGRGVFVAENYPYKPLAGVLRRILERGDVGDPLLLQVDAVKRQRPAGWRADPALAGGGGLMEGGIHWVSFLANLGLEPEDAVGFRAGATSSSTEETFLAAFRYQGGAVGSLSFSWEVPSPLHGVRLSRIYGREGTVRFESNGLFVAVQGRRTRLHLPGLRDMAGYGAMFHDFLGAIRTGRDPFMTLDRAERDLRLVHRIYDTSRMTDTLGDA
jgi:predicted dehydrogenase